MMNGKTNYKVPTQMLKKQFNRLYNNNMAVSRFNQMNSKEVLSYIQSVYAQLQLLQQILALDDNSDDTNEDYSKENIKNNVLVDDVGISLQFALNNACSLYDNSDVQTISSILKQIDNAKMSLYELKKAILDNSTNEVLNARPQLTKIKRR